MRELDLLRQLSWAQHQELGIERLLEPGERFVQTGHGGGEADLAPGSGYGRGGHERLGVGADVGHPGEHRGGVRPRRG